MTRKDQHKRDRNQATKKKKKKKDVSVDEERGDGEETSVVVAAEDTEEDVWQLAMDEKATAMTYRGKSDEYDHIISPPSYPSADDAAITTSSNHDSERITPGALQVSNPSRSGTNTNSPVVPQDYDDIENQSVIVVPEASLVIEDRHRSGNDDAENTRKSSQQLDSADKIDVPSGAHITATVTRIQAITAEAVQTVTIDNDDIVNSSKRSTGKETAGSSTLEETKRRKVVRYCILVTLLVIAGTLIAILVSVKISNKTTATQQVQVPERPTATLSPPTVAPQQRTSPPFGSIGDKYNDEDGNNADDSSSYNKDKSN